MSSSASARAPQALIQLLNQHVTHIKIGHQVHFHVTDEKIANLISTEFAKDSRLQRDPPKYKRILMHCYAITLKKQQFNTLFGNKMYETLHDIKTWPDFGYNTKSCEKHLEGYLPEILQANLLLQLFQVERKSCVLLFPFVQSFSQKFWENLLRQVPKGYLDPIANLVNPFSHNILHEILKLTDTQANGVLLLEHLSDAAFNKMIEGDDTFAILMRCTTEICLKLLSRVSDATLAKAAVMQNDDGYNPLQMALLYQPPETCITLIDRLPEVILNQVVIQQTKIINALYLALRFQPSETCLRLINKMSAEQTDKAISFTDKQGCQPLMMAAHFQSDAVFIALISKTSVIPLVNAACQIIDEDKITGEGKTTLQIAAQYVSPQSFQALLKRINTPDAKKILNDFFKKRNHQLTLLFETIALYQTVENCHLFLSFLDKEHLDEKEYYSLAGRCINDNSRAHSMRIAMRAIQFKLDGHVTKGKLVTESKQLSSLLDMPEMHEAAETNNALHNLLILSHKHAKSAFLEEKESYPVSDIEQQALDQFKSVVWIKIVRADYNENDKHHREFTEHLFHPQNRQPIRDPKNQGKQGFKLLLAPHRKKSDERKTVTVYEDKHHFFNIIKANLERSHKKNRKYADSTKHPATLISPDVPVGLFGNGKRTLVGYAFMVNPDKIKLMSTQDCGTYTRWWYNENLNSLYGQAGHAQKTVCKTFAEFEERVRQQPFVINEALVKFNKRDLFAIVIADYTKEACRLAIQRRLHLQRRFGVDLPIIFYNPENPQRVKIYASAQQRHEHPKLFLDEIERVLEEQCQPTPRKISAFFRKEPEKMIELSLDFKVYSLTPQNAQQILAIIKENRDAWEKALELIMQALPAAQVAKVKRCG